jgi:Domain of unknown function (DUF397)
MALTIEEPRLLEWRKARRSMGNGDCVEVAPVRKRILLRDSKDPDGPILEYSRSSWLRFTMKVKNGAYDLPTLRHCLSAWDSCSLVRLWRGRSLGTNETV